MSKLALLTGGSRGIGRATAELLRAHGWQVDTPTRTELDFDNVPNVLAWMAKALYREAPDAIVFCHGYWTCQYDNLLDDWYAQFQNRVAVPMMVLETFLRCYPPPSVVVSVASNRGFFGGHNTGPYSAANAAQIALMTGYAREVPGTRFNCVAPGLTATDMAVKVKATLGAKLKAVPQPASVVAEAIVGQVEGEANGETLLVVEGKVQRATWAYA